jgi:hypothetical protein
MRRCCNYAHGVSVLSFSSNHRLLIGELHLGKLSETVVVHGNAPHDRPRFLVNHLIGNRASFLCTKRQCAGPQNLDGIGFSGARCSGAFLQPPNIKNTNRAVPHSRQGQGPP